MAIEYGTYRFLSSGLYAGLLPLIWSFSHLPHRYQDEIRQRTGHYRKNLLPGPRISPRIWLHAASVGEVGVAQALIGSLLQSMPAAEIILSTTTRHGQWFAEKHLNSRAIIVYAPLDFFVATRRALIRFKPDIFVCLETEIWPNWFVEARRLQIPCVIANGRISVRSVGRYKRLQPIMTQTLSHIAAFSMIHAEDARRIKMIGAPPERVYVNGNAKYDILLRQSDPDIQVQARYRYTASENVPVIVAGSTRGIEDDIILEAYANIRRDIPEAVLILAPRHIGKARAIAEKARSCGFACQFQTDIIHGTGTRNTPVVVIDTMGDLRAAYSIATVVFCGGSLVPLGGQNVLEAAVWGKPVLFGPSMDDFLDARDVLIHSGGGIQVADPIELQEKIMHLLKHPELVLETGRKARQAVLVHQGAAKKHARVIIDLLETPAISAGFKESVKT